MKKKDVLSLCYDTQEFIANIRHQLHEIPELAWEEEKTLSLIEKEIKTILLKSKLSIKLYRKTGGIYVDIDLNDKAKRLLFRADIDGLPIQEETNLPFSSKHPGMMHACGHDCHAAMLLGALKLIGEERVRPLYNLRLVWQRAEEIGMAISGGSSMVKEGVLEGISHAYGLHISSRHKPGTFFSRPGPLASQPGHLYMDIKCSGGHVMHPEIGSNAIDIMTDIHISLRGFALRALGPNEMISFVPSVSKAGSACNIRPGYGTLCYAVRNFLSNERLETFIYQIQKRVEAIIDSYPEARLSSFIYEPGYPSLINDPKSYLFVKHLLNDLEIETLEIPPAFAGEDFSYYLQKSPGSYWVLGAMNQKPIDHHTAVFNPDETVLFKGTAFWLLLATTQHDVAEMALETSSLSTQRP
jgi:amidohydrolase